ncbi:glycosyltransferase family 2 protein [Brachyspira pulli]|uniref:glycosyltransferase family A protein n=1 Tax=Brachyspira pulli TaxID=310721 RepID=UPI003007AA15
MYNKDSVKPLISVIIPTYNRKNMLKEALDSVLKQDYENIEIIVSDNASTDGTDILMEEYESLYNNIIYIKRKKNVGGKVNGYKAYDDYGKGKYIFFLCDDDYLMGTTFFSNAVEIFELNPNVTLVTGQVQMYFEEHDKYYTVPFNNKKLIKGIDYFINQSTITLGGKYQEIIGTFFLVRKEDLDNNPIFRWFRDSADIAIKLYNTSLGDVYFLNEFIGCYRFHKGVRETSDLSNLKEPIISSLKLIDAIIERYTKLYPDYKEFWEEYIPIKIADWYIRDRIIKSFGTKITNKEIKKFLKETKLNVLNKKIYDFLFDILIINKFRFLLSPIIYEHVAKNYIYFSILRIVFYNLDAALVGFLKSDNELRIWFLFFNIKIKLKNKRYYKIPELYAYANQNMKNNDKLDVYYDLVKNNNNQITSYDCINNLIVINNIYKGEAITKNNTKIYKEDKNEKKYFKKKLSNM